jgi:CubicO group peptidase (beta-lactamase class C family)
MIRTALTEIAAAMPGWMQEAHVPGAAVALVQHGAPPAIACFGVLDAGAVAPTPVTPATVFEAASLSKPPFAYAVLKLVAQGRLDLDVPLSDLLPEPLIPDEPRLPLITARRVLSHSTGLPNWRGDKPLALLRDPGERFGYSGEGYVYLQQVVERLTGQTMEEFLQHSLIRPLGMSRTSYQWQTTFEDNYATGHEDDGRPRPKGKSAELNAAASLHTTISDIARFLALMLSPSTENVVCLPDEWLARMLSPQTVIEADDTVWGLGWGLKRVDDEWLFWQWGDNRGFKHLAAGSRDRGLGVCVLTNGENGYRVWSQVLERTLDPDNALLHFLEQL